MSHDRALKSPQTLQQRTDQLNMNLELLSCRWLIYALTFILYH